MGEIQTIFSFADHSDGAAFTLRPGESSSPGTSDAERRACFIAHHQGGSGGHGLKGRRTILG